MGGLDVEFGIGSHFGAALAAGPIFGCGHKNGDDVFATKLLADEPAFDVADQVQFVATAGM